MTAALPMNNASLRAVYDGIASMFRPASDEAARIAHLGWFMGIVGTVVFVFVVAVMGVAFVRRRAAQVDDASAAPPVSERGWIIGGGFIMPVVVLAVVFVASVAALGHAAHADSAAMEIRITGHQWWWTVEYAGDSGIVTANEIHIPVGRRVRLLLRSSDVIHSFWVPQLNGKTDVIPGQTNTMWIAATDTGTYRGACAEYCGLQHARMAMTVVAETPERYAAWLAAQRAPAALPADSAAAMGQAQFLTHACGYCHTIRGTPAGGVAGPDLTHVGSRLTLASGTLVNTPAEMRRWISGAPLIKPGTTMPLITLDSAALDAIVKYLTGLR